MGNNMFGVSERTYSEFKDEFIMHLPLLYRFLRVEQLAYFRQVDEIFTKCCDDPHNYEFALAEFFKRLGELKMLVSSNTTYSTFIASIDRCLSEISFKLA